MWISFGWEHTSTRHHGKVLNNDCEECGRCSPWKLERVYYWITVYFIPIFPYKSYDQVSCPHCKHKIPISTKAFRHLKALRKQ